MDKLLFVPFSGQITMA